MAPTGRPTTTRPNDHRIAVAVRDGDDLFVVVEIVRAEQGDVYVNFLRDDPDWKPHSSYHASGQHHQKSYDRKACVYYKQKPDDSFRGTENVVTTGIASDEPRAINKPYQSAQFSDLFERGIRPARLKILPRSEGEIRLKYLQGQAEEENLRVRDRDRGGGCDRHSGDALLEGHLLSPVPGPEVGWEMESESS